MKISHAQGLFNFPHKALVSALRPGEIIIDFFAGGGGASTALETALGRAVDIALNHNELALAMHAVNHPFTRHECADVWNAVVCELVAGRPVGWFHASPDCTHFSQARGGQPRSKAVRALSWCVIKVAGQLAKVGRAPRIISLENVEQILQWCPLVAKRDPATGRVVTLDEVVDPDTGRLINRIADPGERVSVWNQALVPDRKRLGQTWRHFIDGLRGLGYAVEWRKMVASDYGAGTSRKRLFLIARRDGLPIVWPEPTHGTKPGQLPLVTAAQCIDWSLPCRSIFGHRPRIDIVRTDVPRRGFRSARSRRREPPRHRRKGGVVNVNIIPPITDRLGAHWRQPTLDQVLIDDTHAVVDRAAFAKLAEYSTTLPSAVYPGKMWRARICGVDYLRWFGDGGPDWCTNNQRVLLIVAGTIDGIGVAIAKGAEVGQAMGGST